MDKKQIICELSRAINSRNIIDAAINNDLQLQVVCVGDDEPLSFRSSMLVNVKNIVQMFVAGEANLDWTIFSIENSAGAAMERRRNYGNC